MTGHQESIGTPVVLDKKLTLNAGDWVTVDRAAWFTYHNPGPDQAVVFVAAWVVEPTGTRCGGGCHGKG